MSEREGRAERAQGDVRNVFSGGNATYVIQGRDFGAVHLHLPPPRTAQDRAAAELARVVLAQWRDEAGALGLTGSARLAVGWQADWTVADHREHVGADITGSTAGLAELAAAFRALPAQRLVIIGAPGSGKTSLAILLTLELLSLRDETRPVPVPVPLLVSSWNAGKEHFDVWLARRVHEEYAGLTRDLNRSRIRELVRDRRVLPVLDGLDELPRPLRSAALAGLNRAGADGMPLILTSRAAEYTELVEEEAVLQAAAVIRARPVAGAAAAEYLRGSAHPRRLRQWQALLDHLAHHPEATAARSLSSPLMLWLARTVYARPDADPGELADESRFPDVAAAERHLLDSIVPAAFPTGPASPHQPHPVRDWGHARARRALGFLATHLTTLKTKDLAWWELHRAKPPTAFKAPVLVAGYYLLMAGSSWFQDWIVGGNPYLAFQVAAGALVSMLMGCMGGILLMLSQARKGTLPRRPAGFGRHRSRLSSLFWLLVCLTPIALLLSRDEPLLALGFTVPALLMLVVGAPADTAQAIGPRALLNGERAGTVLMLLGVAPVIGAIGTLYAVQVPNRAVLLGSWVSGTVGAAAVIVTLSPWAQWLLAKATLASLGRLPWSTMAFLEDARRVGLLRQVGGVYRFRHAQLQKHLTVGRRGGARMLRRRRAATRPPWPVRPLPPVSRTPRSVRIPGYVGLRHPRGQPAVYVMMWTLALVWAGNITVGDGWHDSGARQTVGFFVALPLVLDLLIPPLTWRRAELCLDDDGIEFALGKRTTRFEWRDVAEVAARPYEPPLEKNDGTVMLHLRLSPESAPGPRIRVNSAGWIALWPLDSPTGDPDDTVVPPELHDALVRFAGERWRPPAGT